MSDVAVLVEGLSKEYRVGVRQADRSIREAIMDGVAAPWRRVKAGGWGASASETMWALEDVSFKVARGEAVGIIGRNGAGKTTLLKILARITEPTLGSARIRGRVGALLQVGTGFHPELTGRENVYLNGAILGMRKAEIDTKLDEIVAFAEVDRFIDTPVKRYSSGMYLRLAFSVAAHLEPEILLVDEVLAVGDVSFQRKCLGKMGDVTSEGRTVLFVSHNLAAVGSLCQTAILLEGGRVVHDGATNEAITRYVELMRSDAPPNGQVVDGVRITGFRVNGSAETVVDAGSGVRIEFDLMVAEMLSVHDFIWVLRDSSDALVIRDSADRNVIPGSLPPGGHHVAVDVPPLWLTPGSYSCYVKLVVDASGVTRRCVSDTVTIRVDRSDAEGYKRQGVLAPRTGWSISQRLESV